MYAKNTFNMTYKNRTGNECKIIATHHEILGTKTVKVFECKITKGVTTLEGLIFTISEPQFKKDWK